MKRQQPLAAVAAGGFVQALEVPWFFLACGQVYGNKAVGPGGGYEQGIVCQRREGMRMGDGPCDG